MAAKTQRWFGRGPRAEDADAAVTGPATVEVGSDTVTYGRMTGRPSVAVIGNGPSVRRWSAWDLPRDCRIARCNFFFLEDSQRFGRKVDYYFWGLNNPDLHDRLAEVVHEDRYSISRFFCPVPAHALSFRQARAPWAALLDRPIYDHWKVLARHPEIGRFMMSRPMPTTGLQMLATFAVLGVREFHVLGMDFYEGASRYAYEPPEDLVEVMDAKHFRPGYEAGAHSIQLDTSFFGVILESFPDIAVRSYSPTPTMRDVLARRRPIRVSFDNPAFDDAV